MRCIRYSSFLDTPDFFFCTFIDVVLSEMPVQTTLKMKAEKLLRVLS